MSRFAKFAFAVAAIWFVVATVFLSHRTTAMQLMAIAVFPVYFVGGGISLVCMIYERSARTGRSFLPFVAFISALVLPFEIARPIRHLIFIYCLPSCEAVIHQMETGSIRISDVLNPVPEAVPQVRLAYAVLAQRDEDGVLTVEFITEGGFPVKHGGYLYCSSGVIAPHSVARERWPLCRELRPKWFVIAD